MSVLAFYLPQFHRIPQNDAWWGAGFTEWVNVGQARHLFRGHDHPRRAGELGEYDLRNRSVHAAQSALARGSGIDAFCMYFYWFDGQRLLEGPVEAWRSDPALLPYCLAWANEPWTRAWDGKDHEVLMPQTYPQGYVHELFADLEPHLLAPHYVRMHGRPVLVVHRADQLPDAAAFAAELRTLAVAAGLDGVYLVASETTPDLDPRRLGFDAVCEFPPVGANRIENARWAPVAELDPDFRGRLLSYDRIRHWFTTRPPVPFVRHRGVMPMWDNTARRGLKATIYVEHSPDRYRRWLQAAIAAEQAERGESGLVFINAWNEWAEGAYLEPDATYGRAYLEATAQARDGDPVPEAGPTDTVASGRWSAGHVHSLALLCAGTGLARWRSLRNRRAHPERVGSAVQHTGIGRSGRA